MTVERVERVISGLLRIGVTVSLAVVVVGIVLSFVHHPGYLGSGQDLGGLTRWGGMVPVSVGAVWSGILAGHGEAVVLAGLMLLIATPVLRVAVSVVIFLLQRDWVFVAITLVVLGLLLAAFVVGAK